MVEDTLPPPPKGTIPMDQNSGTETGKKEKRFPVVEVFGPTVEGEGSLIGTQTLFIRFGLCDYRCTKCDSMHAVDPLLVKAGATWMTAHEIVEYVLGFRESNRCEHIANITFSGGNPAIHDLSELVQLFKEASFQIFVETQGTKHPKWLLETTHVVVSPKSPGMGEKFNPEVFKEFLDSFGPYADCMLTIKIVVFSAQDLEFAVGIADILNDAGYYGLLKNFYLSLGNPFPPKFTPSANGITQSRDDVDLIPELLSRYRQILEEIMQDPRLGFVKFLPQLHVLAWGNETGK